MNSSILRMSKRFISMIVAISMIMSLLPLTVFAAEPDEAKLQIYAIINASKYKDHYNANDVIWVDMYFNNPDPTKYDVGMIFANMQFDPDVLEQERKL